MDYIIVSDTEYFDYIEKKKNKYVMTTSQGVELGNLKDTGNDLTLVLDDTTIKLDYSQAYYIFELLKAAGTSKGTKRYRVIEGEDK